MAWTDPRTWVAGETITAALFNTHVRDNFKVIGDPWTEYTPTWAGGSAIGNGTMVGRYTQAGQRVDFYVTITMGSTTTFGAGAWTLTLPVAAVANRAWAFTGHAYDTSAGSSNSFPILGTIVPGNSVVNLRCDSTTAGNGMRNVLNTNPFTWASGDVLFVGGTYEVETT